MLRHVTRRNSPKAKKGMMGRCSIDRTSLIEQSWCDHLAGVISVHELAEGQGANGGLNKIAEEQ